MSDTPSADSQPGLRLLALGKALQDGGGIRGLSELEILGEIMKRIQAEKGLEETPRPCEYFDMIGGTGTGGLLAIMLGRLGMSVEEATAAYVDFARTVFSKRKWFFKNETFKASVLERVMKKIVLGHTGDTDSRMNADRTITDCKAFVCAMPGANLAVPRIFRSYDVKENRSYNCKVWEAACATLAAPTFFKSIELGEEVLKEAFVDAGLGCNNPVRLVLGEAHSVYGKERRVACIVSIGAGHPNVIGLHKPGAFQKILPTGLIKVLKGIADDCEKRSEEFEKSYRDDNATTYFRFNVQQGLQKVSLAEWDKLGEVKTHTLKYTGETQVGKNINQLREILTAGPVLERRTMEGEVIDTGGLSAFPPLEAEGRQQPDRDHRKRCRLRTQNTDCAFLHLVWLVPGITMGARRLNVQVLQDGGGIRGLSELLILGEIMERIKADKGLPKTPRPCEYFDIIGGTSTGG
ncbi:hypothetical protein H0H81_008484, partial [Sphagnurus paluster]